MVHLGPCSSSGDAPRASSYCSGTPSVRSMAPEPVSRHEQGAIQCQPEFEACLDDRMPSERNQEKAFAFSPAHN